MPKPDPELLNPARYPYRCELQTRFGDTDLNRHLNNVAIAGLVEEARVRFNASLGLSEVMAGLGGMNASLLIDFLAQAYYPQPIQALSAVVSVGRTSWTTLQLLVQDDRPVALSRSVLVCTSGGRSAPLPDELSARLQERCLR